MPNNFENGTGDNQNNGSEDKWRTLVGFGSDPEYVNVEEPQAEKSDDGGETYELPGFGSKPTDSYVGKKPAQDTSYIVKETTFREFGDGEERRTFKDVVKPSEYVEDVEFGSDNPQRRRRLEPVLPEKPKTSLLNKEADIPFGTDENNGETSL